MTPPRVEPPKGLRRHWVNIECALEAAQSCLRNETPETMPPEAAREWTLFSIREALLTALPAVRAVAPCVRAEAASLRQRAEAAERDTEGLRVILRTTQRDMENAIMRAEAAEQAAGIAGEHADDCKRAMEELEKRDAAWRRRVAELEAALRPFANAWHARTSTHNGPIITQDASAYRGAASALAKGGAG